MAEFAGMLMTGALILLIGILIGMAIQKNCKGE